MRRARGTVIALIVLGGCAAPRALFAQAGQQNASFMGNFKDDLAQERVNFGGCKKPGLTGISNCAETLFTGTPFHIAVGSFAPQNGVAFGIAGAEVYHPTYCASWIDGTKAPPAGTRNACHWSLNFNLDAEASTNESWEAGFYMTAVHLSTRQPQVHMPGQPEPRHPVSNFTGPSTTVNFYSRTTSLNRIYFYGLGAATAPGDRSDFGLTENITGVSFIVPVHPWWLDRAGISLLGEINGRFPSERGSYGDTSLSIERVYDGSSAPGLGVQSNFFQAGEGIRFTPDLPISQLHLNYLANFQQYVGSASAGETFRRFTADLGHQLVLYTKNVGKARPPLPQVPGTTNVPPISATRDVTGSISARLFIQQSIADSGNVVPFYFQPTIGGSDLNGQAILASYPDYRFRGPNLWLLHGDYEQSLGKIPIGAFFGVDDATVALRRDDTALTYQTYSAGFTIHAGGLPVVYLLFAWGGSEGHHIIANINSSLLGGSTKPSLF